MNPKSIKHSEFKIANSLPMLAFCPVESCAKENEVIPVSPVTFLISFQDHQTILIHEFGHHPYWINCVIQYRLQ